MKTKHFIYYSMCFFIINSTMLIGMDQQIKEAKIRFHALSINAIYFGGPDTIQKAVALGLMKATDTPIFVPIDRIKLKNDTYSNDDPIEEINFIPLTLLEPFLPILRLT